MADLGTKTIFGIPTREEVSEANQAIFDQLNKGIGFVPNLYAYYAKSPSALGDYLTLQNRKTSLSNKEKEIDELKKKIAQLQGI